MDKMDQWLRALGAEGDFGEAAAARLDRRLTGEPTPRAKARERGLLASAALALAAGVAGAAVGAALQAQAVAAAPLLPGSTAGTAADLLLGDG